MAAFRLLLPALLMLTSLGCAAQPKPVTETKTQTAGNPKVAVFVTAKGKTYHTYRDCMSLSRAKTVLSASEADAEQHGLTLCGICAHRHHSATNNSAWAKQEAK